MRLRGEVEKSHERDLMTDRFTEKARLNLNDLLRKRSEEKKVDKKTNLIIISSATVVFAIVLLILNL